MAMTGASLFVIGNVPNHKDVSTTCKVYAHSAHEAERTAREVAHKKMFEKVVDGFIQYMERKGLKVSRAEFEENLLKKLSDAAFREDIVPLLRDELDYDFDKAAQYMFDEIVSKLSGKPRILC